MTFNATSLVIPLPLLLPLLLPAVQGPGDVERDPALRRLGRMDKEGRSVVDLCKAVLSASAAAPRSAVAIWFAGTCHVVRCETKRKRREERSLIN